MMRLPCLIEAEVVRLLPAAAARRAVQKQSPIHSADLVPTKRKIFVDVSVFATHDAGTGIQRVVREVLGHLLNSPRDSFAVIPVAATRSSGYCTTTAALGGSPVIEQPAGLPISPAKGDVFLGLDLAAHLLPRHWVQLLRWKRAGASIQIVVYDLLPALRPDWFNPKAVKNFKAWLQTLAVFVDRFHCISATVKADLIRWFKNSYGIALQDRAACIFPLGSNLESATPATESALRTSLENEAITFAQRHPTALMVGTIEPRKGHTEVLNAFLEIWRQGAEHQLIVAGAPGWKTEALQQKLANASTGDNKLIWLRDADDALLAQLYQSASGVIVASEGEGYGLPLIEAAFFGKPVLARDIPVFREVARGNVTFFPNAEHHGLTPQALFKWLASCTSNARSTSHSNMPNWATTTAVLLANMGVTKLIETTE